MSDVEEIRGRLAEAGRRLADADAQRRTALDDIAAAMREGKGRLGIKQMAETAGVSRVTAYRLIED